MENLLGCSNFRYLVKQLSHLEPIVSLRSSRPHNRQQHQQPKSRNVAPGCPLNPSTRRQPNFHSVKSVPRLLAIWLLREEFLQVGNEGAVQFLYNLEWGIAILPVRSRNPLKQHQSIKYHRILYQQEKFKVPSKRRPRPWLNPHLLITRHLPNLPMDPPRLKATNPFNAFTLRSNPFSPSFLLRLHLPAFL